MPDDVSIHVNRGIKQVCICWGLGYSGCRDNNIADHLWNSYDPIFVNVDTSSPPIMIFTLLTSHPVSAVIAVQ